LSSCSEALSVERFLRMTNLTDKYNLTNVASDDFESTYLFKNAQFTQFCATIDFIALRKHVIQKNVIGVEKVLNDCLEVMFGKEWKKISKFELIKDAMTSTQ